MVSRHNDVYVPTSNSPMDFEISEIDFRSRVQKSVRNSGEFEITDFQIADSKLLKYKQGKI